MHKTAFYYREKNWIFGIKPVTLPLPLSSNTSPSHSHLPDISKTENWFQIVNSLIDLANRIFLEIITFFSMEGDIGLNLQFTTFLSILVYSKEIYIFKKAKRVYKSLECLICPKIITSWWYWFKPQSYCLILRGWYWFKPSIYFLYVNSRI